MRYKIRCMSILIYLIFISCIFSLVQYDVSDPTLNSDECGKVFTANTSVPNYFNATVISDGFKGIYWNDGISENPSVAVDNDENLHVVWQDYSMGPWWDDDVDIMYANYSSLAGWSNITVISDGFEGFYWNSGDSNFPSIAIDNIGNIHVVWEDGTNGPWGNDQEIMYVNYTSSEGWSNVTVISDDETNWNNDHSYGPSISIDNNDIIHVVWSDRSDGLWKQTVNDLEIMYANYSSLAGWSNATVISDDDTNWNNDWSFNPSIDIDNGGSIHVVWDDDTNGPWGNDKEIMYVNHTSSEGWSNVTVISDDETNWNNDFSNNPSITIDNNDIIHVVWGDRSDGPWRSSGSDYEIMYVNYSSSTGWSNATVISDGFEGFYWNNGYSDKPSVAIDNIGNIHVVWEDTTLGPWTDGEDNEIMYVRYSSLTGWSNVTVISDGYGGVYWNNYDSGTPSIAVDNGGIIHVVWYDGTEGPWGDDGEIMYTFIDEIAPTIIIKSPTQNEFIGNEAPDYNISIDEPYIHSTWYTLDGGTTNIPFSGFTGTINQTEWDKKGDGTVTIRFYANDTLGNEGYDNVSVRKDTIAPTSSISYNIYKEPNGVNKSTIFTLIANDEGGSGVSTIRYKINDSVWFDYSTPFNLSQYAYGDIRISYHSIDEVGNTEEENSLIVELIDVSPSGPSDTLIMIIIIVASIVGVVGVGIITFVLRKKKRTIVEE